MCALCVQAAEVQVMLHLRVSVHCWQPTVQAGCSVVAAMDQTLVVETSFTNV